MYMKKASWGYYVSKIESSGEPVALPRVAGSGVSGGSRTEFQVERTLSRDDGQNVTMITLMGALSNVHQFCNCIKRSLV